MIESFAHKEARLLAKKLLAEAAENEPQITAGLQKIASEISAELVGLEYKFKQKKSLIRKLIDKTVISSQNRKFELQFHTKESYDLKNKTHFLY